MSNLKEQSGAFASSLLRNASKIKEDRALAILRNGEKHFRRQVEDIQDRIANLQSERDALLDMSPTDINSLVLASDFKAEEFYNTIRKITLSIREARVELEEMQAQYQWLFGVAEATEKETVSSL
jgi:hypothetical protein